MTGFLDMGPLSAHPDPPAGGSERTGGSQSVSLRAFVDHVVNDREVVLRYQPIVALSSGNFVAFEALVERTRRGAEGDASGATPNDRLALQDLVDRWLLQETCNRIRRWQLAFPTDPPLGGAMKLSHRRLHDLDFPSDVADSVVTSHLGPSSLIFEISEDVLLAEPRRALAVIRVLRELGVRVALDQFAPDFSSLKTIARFPMQIVKIDSSLIDHIPDDTEATALVSGIVGLAHSLGLQVVADGVSRYDQVRCLQTLECDAGQGPQLGPVTDPGDVDDLLSRARSRRG